MKRTIKMNYKAKTIICFIQIILLLSLLGCSENSLDTLSEDNKELIEWKGEYHFEEFISSNIAMDYTINIYSEDDNYFADITIDGFQTMVRIRAQVIGDQESIELRFEKYLSEHLNKTYDEGELLVNFKNEDQKILTYWHRIKPIQPEHEEEGKMYFEKVRSF